LEKRKVTKGNQAQWQQIDVSKVKPYSKNTKKHPDDQVQKIARSIQEFGWDQPIVTDKDMVIIKGHGRLLAAKVLGLTQVPVLIRSDLTPTQVKASRIADNRVAESDWDIDMLKFEITDLQEEQFNLDILGFTDREIKDLLVDEVEPEEGLSIGGLEYKVIVDVPDEYAQEKLVEKLEQDGYKCRVLIS